ncbi:head-tail connector protein [Gordonia phage Hedwig]|uniref:Head-to-tail connector protein n=1 Tax=Gordonia phage Hedwig TaxID=1887648 RepID=A0A1C9EHP4_9CAUD|nr:head-tail connector protein [Gordonia phage Hedwig]AON97301.1 head-to-tail connector protein [Gordonia phage Hedwig]
MSYRVIAPLVVAPDDDGQLHYHYEGAEIESIADDAAKRLVADGLLEKAKAAPRSSAAKSSTKAPAKKSTEGQATKGDGGGSGLPPFTAPDEEWVAYAIEQGMDPEDAKTTPRQDLIAKFAQQ